MNFHAASRQGTPLTLTSRKGVGHAKSRNISRWCFSFYSLAQHSCGGNIGSVPYVCTFVRSYVHLLSSL